MRDFIATVVLILFLVHVMKLMLRKVAVRWIASIAGFHSIWRLDPIRDRIETRSIPHGKREP